MAIVFGETFGDEIIAAGLGGLPFSWTSDGIITGRENLTTEQNTTLDGVIAAHDPTKKRKNIIPFGDFIGRWTNQEWVLMEQHRASDIQQTRNLGEWKRWDIHEGYGEINLNNQSSQDLKAFLVADGILTQARADEIFA